MSEKSQAICVLGTGRSGTSLAMRALTFMGVEIGSNLIPPDDNNLRGYWEDTEIVSIQKKLRDKYGSPLPLVDSKWQSTRYTESIKQSLSDYVSEHYLHYPLWGWKDPRTSESLAIWEEIAKDLHFDIHYLVVVRNPIDVAKSFNKAWDIPLTKALLYWKTHVLIDLYATLGKSVVVCDYHQWINQPLYCLKKVAEVFGLPWKREDETILSDKLSQFVTPNLTHSHTELMQLMQEKNLDPTILHLYQICQLASHAYHYLEVDHVQQTLSELYHQLI